VPRAGGDYSGYVIETTLGRGGSATVYLARRISDGLRVALKVLDEEHRDTRQMAWLEHRYALLRQLDHPHIVRYVELGPYWAATRYVDGGNVTTVGRAERFTALTQIADALDYTHRKGIVHCDVKPANILVHADFAREGAVLIDFGVAHSLAEDMAARLARDPSRFSLDPARRITHQEESRPAVVQASLPYASPEILLGWMPSAASDQYSLACSAVELLTGQPPFEATTAGALIEAHLQRHPPRMSSRNAGIPRSADPIVAKALAKDPEQRYETCSRFIELLTLSLRQAR
jgi:serine/threonine-protein kinase